MDNEEIKEELNIPAVLGFVVAVVVLIIITVALIVMSNNEAPPKKDVPAVRE